MPTSTANARRVPFAVVATNSSARRGAAPLFSSRPQFGQCLVVDRVQRFNQRDEIRPPRTCRSPTPAIGRYASLANGRKRPKITSFISLILVQYLTAWRWQIRPFPATAQQPEGVDVDSARSAAKVITPDTLHRHRAARGVSGGQPVPRLSPSDVDVAVRVGHCSFR